IELRARLDRRDAGAPEIALIQAFETGDLSGFVADGRAPIERAARSRPREPPGLAELGGTPRGIDEGLLRHAHPGDARAAEPSVLGDRNLRSMAGRNPRRPDAARTAADDEKIEIRATHEKNPAYLPKCAST